MGELILRALERMSGLLAGQVDTIERFLDALLERSKEFLKQAGHFIGKLVISGLKLTRILLLLLSILLALVLLHSICIEGILERSIWIKFVAWPFALIFSVAILGYFLMFFSWRKWQRPAGKQHDFTKLSILINVVLLAALGVSGYSGYTFQYPLLRGVQSSVLDIAGGIHSAFVYFKNSLDHWISSDSAGSKQVDRAENQKSQAPPPPPEITKIPVRSVGENDLAYTTAIKQSWSPGESQRWIDYALNMWVEQVWVADSRTVLDVAVKTWDGTNESHLQYAENAYIVDDKGNRYNLSQDKGKYSNEHIHICKEDEIYRFQLVFVPKVNHRTTYIYLHHPQFDKLRVEFDWVHAAKTIEK